MYHDAAQKTTGVNLVYDALLKELKKVVSTDHIRGSSQSELNRAGSSAFGTSWGGCLALDSWSDIKHDYLHFYIINTVPSAENGKVGHWLAVHQKKVWDSYHRPLSSIVPSIVDAHPFIELNCLHIHNQPDLSDDCGERCIAALELYRALYLNE